MTAQPESRTSTPPRPAPDAGFLAERTILVAGGSGNVGRHIVAALLEADARVIVPTRSRPKLDEIRSIHGDAPDGPIALIGDVTDEDDGPRILEEALRGRPLDGAVASLGAFVPTRSVLSATREQLSRAVEGYLMAHHGAARSLIPHLRESGGSYTMIQGPLAFDIWSPEASLVSVATAAQAMLAQAIMKEEGAGAEGRPGVRVNELVLHSAVGWEDAEKRSPLEPMDVGRFVARMAAPAAAEIRGQTIHLKSPDQLHELAART